MEKINEVKNAMEEKSNKSYELSKKRKKIVITFKIVGIVLLVIILIQIISVYGIYLKPF